MKRTLRTAALTLAGLPAGLGIGGCGEGTESEPSAAPPAIEETDFRLRSDVEAALPDRAEAFAADPGDDVDARRAYADILHKLGNMWEADEVIAPLGDPASENVPNLQLAARLAYLLGDYERAETLYRRLMQLTEEGSEDRADATEGLTLSWYQTNRFARARGTSPARGHPGGIRSPRLHAGVRGSALRDRLGDGGARLPPGDDERHHPARRPSAGRSGSGRPDRVARPRHRGATASTSTGTSSTAWSSPP